MKDWRGVIDGVPRAVVVLRSIAGFGIEMDVNEGIGLERRH